MNSSADLLKAEIEHFKRSLSAKGRLVVAFSGGLDSTVLLHCLAQDATLLSRLQAVHVNHQLEEASQNWVAHCEAFCQQLAIPFECLTIQVPERRRRGVEERARQARYEALYSRLQADDILLTAHHQRDQAETLLLNLARGAGVKGLAAMPACKELASLEAGKGRHCRPLLRVPFPELQRYALARSLSWIEDPSNARLDLRRNYIRHRLLPDFKSLWPEVERQLSTAAEHMAEAATLLQRMAARELDAHGADSLCLDLERYAHLDVLEMKNLLRHWAEGTAGTRIGRKELEWIMAQFMDFAIAQGSRKTSQGEFVYYHNKLYYLSEFKEDYAVSFEQAELVAQSTLSGRNPRFELRLPRMWLNSNRSRLVVRNLRSSDHLGGKLKKWFQSSHVPPWLRRCWPVLAVDDKPIAVWGAPNRCQPVDFPADEVEDEALLSLLITEQGVYELARRSVTAEMDSAP